MDRMQIYLETEQRLRLAALARAQGRPQAELIREALSRYLGATTESISGDDSLFSLIGAAGDLEQATDVASNHHRYLATADSARQGYAGKKNRAGTRSTRKTPRKRPGR
jgi:hypothetical protein